MYCFEGQYRRAPRQNLGGSSNTQPKKEDFLRQAQIEREQRKMNKRREAGTIRIQAFVRSYTTRRRLNADFRTKFDDTIRRIGLTEVSSTVQIDDDVINYLLTLIVFFYRQDEDRERLKIVTRYLILNMDMTLSNCCLNTNNWFWKMKRLLLMNLNLVTSTNARDSFAVHMRIVAIFTSDDCFLKYCQREVAYAKLCHILSYLLRNGYFDKLKVLVCTRVPLPMLMSDRPQTAFGVGVLDFIVRPLKLAYENVDPNFSSLVLQRFIITFLLSDFNYHSKYFVVPCLAPYPYFPFKMMIETLCEFPESFYGQISGMLYSVLYLEKDDYMDTCDAEMFCKYLRVLSIVSRNFAKLAVVEMYRKASSLQDDEWDSDDENETSKSSVSELEAELLEDSILKINSYHRLQQIISKTMMYRNTEYDEGIVCSLAKVCYYVFLARRSRPHEYKMLSILALNKHFMRRLWSIVVNAKQKTLFGNTVTFFNIISRGLDLPPSDVYEVVPLFTTFCSLLKLLMCTVYDDEGHKDAINSYEFSTSMPFTLLELAQISEGLREICIGLVELAYPDSRPDFKIEYNKVAQNEKTADPEILKTWRDLFKVAVNLLRQLYVCDMRKQFCPDGMWLSSRLSTMKIVMPSSTAINDTYRASLRPFSGKQAYTREDISEGPPLSTRELRSIAIIRDLPFLLEFKERVVVFQNHIMKDKLEHQGTMPYAGMGRAIHLVVRRNYLYEDAYEKLSLNNESNLRYLMKINMRNAAGTSEVGVDGGGVFREFMSELLKTAFDPNRGFFRLTNDNELYPNPNVAAIHQEYVSHYFFIGRMMGKALYENLLVELPLAEFFLSKLVSRQSDVGIHNLQSLDPVLYRSLQYLKDCTGDVSDVGLDFTILTNELGQTVVHELKPDGANIPVTNENKIEYIYAVADFKLNKEIRIQTQAFKKGLADILKPEWLQIFGSKELQSLISGAELPIDVKDWQKNTRYSGGYAATSPMIILFWEVVEKFDEKNKRLLLKFVTSCSKQPLFGFKDLQPPFCIQKAGTDDRLPTASTCMNLLKLPEFKDRKMLEQRLIYAIQSNAGFELS